MKTRGLSSRSNEMRTLGFRDCSTPPTTTRSPTTTATSSPVVNAAALAANHFFHITYVAPVTGTLNLVYNTSSGWHASTTINYESGYRYGVGTKTFVFAANGQPEQVLNTDLAATTPSEAYYFTDPTNPGTMEHPNIVGSRGTPEGPGSWKFVQGRRSPPWI